MGMFEPLRRMQCLGMLSTILIAARVGTSSPMSGESDCLAFDSAAKVAPMPFLDAKGAYRVVSVASIEMMMQVVLDHGGDQTSCDV